MNCINEFDCKLHKNRVNKNVNRKLHVAILIYATFSDYFYILLHNNHIAKYFNQMSPPKFNLER